MRKSDRSIAIELAKHADEITAWRETLTEKQRRRLIHPLSHFTRWKRETQPKPRKPRSPAPCAWRKVRGGTL
jgi:hypothetical protein